MANAKPRHNEKILEHLTAQVLDHGAKLFPLVEQLNAGNLPGFPAYSISYSTAYKYIARVRNARDAAAPLSSPELDRFYKRLWAVTQGEIRKVERDARKPAPLDLKRVNGLEETASRLKRHLANRDSAPEPALRAEPEPATESLLTALAATEPAPSTATTHTKPTTKAGLPKVAPDESPATSETEEAMAGHAL